jgi:hypothetical protein
MLCGRKAGGGLNTIGCTALRVGKHHIPGLPSGCGGAALQNMMAGESNCRANPPTEMQAAGQRITTD